MYVGMYVGASVARLTLIATRITWGLLHLCSSFSLTPSPENVILITHNDMICSYFIRYYPESRQWTSMHASVCPYTYLPNNLHSLSSTGAASLIKKYKQFAM